MIKLFKSHPKLSKFVIISFVCVFLIAIGDFIHYSNRISQINAKLSQYGDIGYSVKKIDYPYHYGLFTEMFIYSNQLDTFYLHDNENDFDFVVLIRDQGNSVRRDNYMECYVGNRFANLCQKEIHIPQECKIQNFQIYAIAPYNKTNTLTLNSFKTMTDEELKQAIQDTVQSINEGVLTGNLVNFRIQLEINGNQIQAEQLINQVEKYLKNIVPNVSGKYLINGTEYHVS